MASLAFPIARLVDPIFALLLLVAAGLLLSGGGQIARPRAARLGRAIAWSGWLALWLLATPAVSAALARRLSTVPRDLHADLASTPIERRAMIVLSAGIDPDEFGVPAMERITAPAMERCIGAARIFKTYGFGRVIISGGDPSLPKTELGSGMADLLVALGVPREKIVLEPDSTDTRENALYSTRLARELHIDKAVVVTEALHMPRAVWLFERAGLTVLPAPVRFQGPPPPGLERFIPAALSLRGSQRVVHELVGRLEPQ